MAVCANLAVRVSRILGLSPYRCPPAVAKWMRSTQNGEVNMRNWIMLAMAGVLAVVISMPASAATKKKVAPTGASFEACERKAIGVGLPRGQAGHNGYVRECMGGRPTNSHPPN
jgi:hypothetical protein